MPDDAPIAEGRFPFHLLTCENCGRQFPDPMVSNHPNHGNARFAAQDNYTRCVCGSLVKSLDFVSVQTEFGNRLFPTDGRATMTPRQVRGPLSYEKEIRFAGGVKFGESPTFSLKQNRQDLYLVSREMPEWKYSIHASGVDNLSFTSNENASKFGYLQKNGSRHIFEMPRTLPLAAHASRVAIIDIKQPPFNIETNLKGLKEKYRKKLKFQKYSGGLARFELFYTEGDPAHFFELEELRSATYGIFKPFANEIFSLAPRSQSPIGELKRFITIEKDIFKVKIGITKKNCAYILFDYRE